MMLFYQYYNIQVWVESWDSCSNLNIFSTYLTQAKYFLLNGFHCNLFIVSLACLCSNISSEAAKFRLYVNPMFDTKKKFARETVRKIFSFIDFEVQAEKSNQYFFSNLFALNKWKLGIPELDKFTTEWCTPKIQKCFQRADGIQWYIVHHFMKLG